jgi:hypothetical protein
LFCFLSRFQRHHHCSISDAAEGLNSSSVNYFLSAQAFFGVAVEIPLAFVRLFRSSLYTHTHTGHQYLYLMALQ